MGCKRAPWCIQPMARIVGNTWLLTVAATFVLVACGISHAEEADELAPVEEPGVALDFALLDAAGTMHRLSDYDDHVVLVTFWASWCPQCLWEMPAMEQLWRSLKGEGLILLGVSVGEDAKSVSAFTDSNGISFPVLLDTDLAVYKEWPVLGLPTSFLVGKQGKPVYKVVGALDWQDATVVAKVRCLLSLSTKPFSHSMVTP